MSAINKSSFQNLKVLVIGDAMIDRYFDGSIKRKSPEANVPVLNVSSTKDKLGGAANVALNISTLGAQSFLLSVAGNDSNAKVLESLCAENNIKHAILKDAQRPTTVKNRLYNGTEYLLRFDDESDIDISESQKNDFLRKLENVIAEFKPDVAILQDYNKGVFTKNSIPAIITILNSNQVKIAVDPKKENFFAFQNIDLFKPNLKEIAEATQNNINPKDLKELQFLGKQVLNKLNATALLLTLSENGVFIYSDNENHLLAAHKRTVVDVSGAGDTVIAVAAMLFGLNFPLEKIAYFSNLAGGLTIEHKGVKTLSFEELFHKF